MKCLECGKQVPKEEDWEEGKICSEWCFNRYQKGIETYGTEEKYKEEKDWMKQVLKGRV